MKLGSRNIVASIVSRLWDGRSGVGIPAGWGNSSPEHSVESSKLPHYTIQYGRHNVIMWL